jgi:hypothetical protein
MAALPPKLQTAMNGSDGALLGEVSSSITGPWIKKTTENTVFHFGKTYLEPIEAEYRTIEYYK